MHRVKWLYSIVKGDVTYNKRSDSIEKRLCLLCEFSLLISILNNLSVVSLLITDPVERVCRHMGEHRNDILVRTQEVCPQYVSLDIVPIHPGGEMWVNARSC